MIDITVERHVHPEDECGDGLFVLRDAMFHRHPKLAFGRACVAYRITHPEAETSAFFSTVTSTMEEIIAS